MGIEVRDAKTYGPLSPKQAWCRSVVRPSILALSILAAFSLPSRLLSVEGSTALTLLLTVGIDAGLLLAGSARQVLSEKITGTVTVFSGLPATQSAKAIA